MKTIEFYRREVYGRERDFVADEKDAAIFQNLLGRKTLTGRERELIRDLTGGMLNFKQILPPSK